LDDDYNALIDEKSNIYNEWPELSKKLEILLEQRIIKDKTFAKQLEEIQLYEEGNGIKILKISNYNPKIDWLNKKITVLYCRM